MSNQLHAPLLAVAPKPAAPDVFEHDDLAPVTPETQAHMRMLQCFDARMSNSGRFTTTVAKGAEGETFAETLAGFRGSFPPSMSIAATLLRSHGDMARTRHARSIEGEWSPVEVRIDALLSMAGVPEAVQLEVVK